jgi:hypothetical protein
VGARDQLGPGGEESGQAGLGAERRVTRPGLLGRRLDRRLRHADGGRGLSAASLETAHREGHDDGGADQSGTRDREERRTPAVPAERSDPDA